MSGTIPTPSSATNNDVPKPPEAPAIIGRAVSKRTVRFALPVALFAVIGTVAVLFSHAAVVLTALEPETATLTSGATSISDTTASGGKAIKFGAVSSTTTPPPTTTQTTNCAPKPSACGYPDATNTGPVAGTSLTHVTGDYRITTPGVTVSNLDIDGSLDISADNVTVKNCRIRGVGITDWVVSLYTDSTLQNVEIGGGASGTDFSAATAIYTGGNNSGNKIVSVNIHHTQDGIRLDGGTTVQDSYIHSLNFNYPYHSDGMQATQGDNDIINHNTIEGGNNDAIFFQSTGSDPITHNVTINNNLLIGVQVAPGDLSSYGVSNETAANVSLTNNHFNRIWQVVPAGGSFVTISGNVYDDNGAPYTQ